MLRGNARLEGDFSGIETTKIRFSLLVLSGQYYERPMILQGLERDVAISVGEAGLILFSGWLLSFSISKLIGLIVRPEGEKGQKTVERLRRLIRKVVASVSFLSAICLSGLNAYLLVSKRGVWSTQLEYLAKISPEARLALAFGLVKIVVGAWLCSFALGWSDKGIVRLGQWAKSLSDLTKNDESINRLTTSFNVVVQRCSWLAFAWFSAATLGLPDAAVNAVLIGIKVYALISSGLLLWRSLDVAIETAQELSRRVNRDNTWMGFYDSLQFLVPLFRRSVEYIIYVTFASMAVAQVDFIAWLAEWGPRTIRVIGYFFMARVAVAIATVLTDEWAARRKDREDSQRILTLVPLFQSILKYSIYFFVGVAILGEIGVDPGPILAGAGIVGLAVGMGAQSVIKDVVTGFFVLFEDYFGVGDFVQIGDVKGVVMGVDLRTTRLRDMEGGLHIIPNGEVTSVVHYSRDYSNAVVDIGVAYDSDLTQVREALLELGVRLHANDERIEEATKVLGVQNLGESDIVVRTLTRTKPGAHFEVARVLREEIKNTFDALGIEIPFPRRVMLFQDAMGREIDHKTLLSAAGKEAASA